MSINQNLPEVLKNYTNGFDCAVPFDAATDRLLLMDFTENNKELNEDIIADTEAFSEYIRSKVQAQNFKYGIGGYNEHRTIYRRSELFNPTPTLPAEKRERIGQPFPASQRVHTKGTLVNRPGELEGAEPRRLHLGIDIWGDAGTSVYAPLEGTVHSFAFNDAYGDYGATLILQHELEGFIFHTLYGHLSLHSIQDKWEGQTIERGEWIAAFGEPAENGHWPPHLHFQLVIDLQGWKGDYPGVCKYSEREAYLNNCPDPDLLLGLMKYTSAYPHGTAGS